MEKAAGQGHAYAMDVLGGVFRRWKAEPYTSPLSQLNLSSCVPVSTQLIPLIHSEMLKLS